MRVVKRNGETVQCNFQKISNRIEHLTYNLNRDYVHVDEVVKSVINGVSDLITTRALDELAARTCAYMSIKHPDYNILAARISISDLHKQTSSSFYETIKRMYEYKNNAGKNAPLVSERAFRVVEKYKEELDNAIVYERDFDYDFFGFKTLEKSYLIRLDGQPIERPQQLLMRVAVGVNMGTAEDFSDCLLEEILETYECLSLKYYTHATPTLFNAGTTMSQLSSCFLIQIESDSIEGIFNTIKDCALISRSAGGLGISISNIRARGAFIRGTNGNSNGVVPMLKVFNDTARYVDQGGGKRKGSFAIYIEPWHPDIEDVLELKKNHGSEELRARDLFYALWTCDLFMKRVRDNATWSLFCPDRVKNLQTTYGEEFEKIYIEAENNGLAQKQLPARDLWKKILTSQIETGGPYMLYKDSVNRKTNHSHLGTLKLSNLCCEINQFVSDKETAVCNLASLSLPSFIRDGKFNFEELIRITKIATRNLNKVIDVSYYPIESARYSNKKHRPIGIGVQGLADVFFELNYSYESEEAFELNKQIFACIYYAALDESCSLAIKYGTYESYEGSHTSKGKFQYHLWDVKPETVNGLLDWEALEARVVKHGLRNSLVTAPMPTASTAQILGNTESFEPVTQNLYMRRVLSGEFVVINRRLLNDLISLNLWTPELRTQLTALNGSVQNLDIPEDLKLKYKTVWEIKQSRVLEMAAARGPYIDQSQSMNIHLANASIDKLTSMHMYAWNLGLKTGSYYLRTQAAADAIKFTLHPTAVAEAQRKKSFSDDICLSCSG